MIDGWQQPEPDDGSTSDWVSIDRDGTFDLTDLRMQATSSCR